MNSYSLRALSILSTLVLTALSLPALAQTEVTEFVRGSDGRITLTWSSKDGVEYRVETSEDLLNWNEQVSTIASGDSSTLILPNTGAARNYYRIVFPFEPEPEREPIVLFGDSYIDGSSGPPAPHVTLAILLGTDAIEEGNDGETAAEIAARFVAGPHTGTLAAMLDQPPPGYASWEPTTIAAGYATFRDAVTRGDGNYIAVIPANRRPHDGLNWGTSAGFIENVQLEHTQLRDLLIAEHGADRVFDWWRWATRSYVPQDASDVADMVSNGESIIPRSLRNSAGGDRNGDHLNAAGHEWMAQGLYQAYQRIEDPSRFTASDKVAHFYPLNGVPTATQIDVVGDNHAPLQGVSGVLSKDTGQFGEALVWDSGDTIRAIAPHFELGDEFAFDFWLKPTSDGARVFQMFGGGGGIVVLTSGGQIRFRAGVAATEVAFPYRQGEWNYVYCQYSSGQLEILVDGRPPATRNLGAVEWGTSSLFIGSNDAGSSNFRGSMHSLAFYNQPLSEAEVKQRYNDGAGERLPGL